MVYINVSAMALKAGPVNMKRLFDLILACIVLAFLILPMLYLAFQVRRSSSGPALYWSARIGQHNQIFMMPKYRSMFIETPEVATHLLNDSTTHITPLGTWLRRTSLDELPQLYSIIVGHMSFVGPRPALFNQDDLKQMRTEKGIHRLKPGMTGLAQINGRDEISLNEKVKLDADYLQMNSLWFDIQILWKTFLKVIKRDNIVH